MTKKELSQLYYLNREIEMQQKQLSQLEEMLNNSNTAVCVQGSTLSLPFSKHSITIQGIENKTRYYELKASIYDTKKLIELNKEKCIYEYNRLNRYIQSVEDSLIRQILTYRYINSMGWQEVANNIGGNNTENSVKQAAHRFIKKSCHKCHE